MGKRARAIAFTFGGLMFASAAAAQAPSRVQLAVTTGRYSVAADHVEGALTSAGVSVEVRVRRYLSLSLDLAKPVGTLRREHTGISSSFAPFGSPREEIERLGVLTRFTNERVVQAVLSAGLVVHSADLSRRVTPRLFVGTTTHFARDRTRLEHLRLPDGVTLGQVTRRHPEDTGRTRGLGALTVGGGAAIGISKHLAVAPELRYDFGSIGDEINDMLRIDLRLLWRF